MKYVIMCGGIYPWFKEPRWLMKITHESILERTLRLLMAQGIRDIAISGFDRKLYGFGIPVIQPAYNFNLNNEDEFWVDGFVLMHEPVCYLYGDVVYSRAAIWEIVNCETNDIQFFGSSIPLHESYIKRYAEPFGFKVVDTEHFKQAIELTKQYHKEGKFLRHPVSWELWQVIKGTPLNDIRRNYFVINDFTCDVDNYADLKKLREVVKKYDTWG